MAHYILFINSVPDGFHESSDIIQWEIKTNSVFREFASQIYSCTDKINFRKLIEYFTENIQQDDTLVLHIFAHGDTEGLAFRYYNEKSNCNDYILWNELIQILTPLNRMLDNGLTLVLQSCLSSNLGNQENFKYACKNLIAGNGVINAVDSKYPLLEFYKIYADKQNCELAFKSMTEKTYYDVFHNIINITSEFKLFTN